MAEKIVNLTKIHTTYCNCKNDATISF